MTGVDGSSAIWAGFRLPEGHVSPQVNALMARNIDFSDEDGNNYMWGPENMVDQAIAAVRGYGCGYPPRLSADIRSCIRGVWVL